METPQEPMSGGPDEPAGTTPPDVPQVPPPSPPPVVAPPPAPPAATAPPAAAAPPPPPAAPPPPSSWEAPEYVAGPAPGYEFGAAGERLVAYVVDILITGLIIVVIAIVGGLVVAAGATANSGFLAGTGAIVLIVALIIVPLAYFPWFWARDGATPGMRMFGLRVVRDSDGGPISGGQAILRLVGYWVDSLVFYLGFIWILIDKRKRGWHDLLAGTVVVKRIG